MHYGNRTEYNRDSAEEADSLSSKSSSPINWSFEDIDSASTVEELSTEIEQLSNEVSSLKSQLQFLQNYIQLQEQQRNQPVVIHKPIPQYPTARTIYPVGNGQTYTAHWDPVPNSNGKLYYHDAPNPQVAQNVTISTMKYTGKYLNAHNIHSRIESRNNRVMCTANILKAFVALANRSKINSNSSTEDAEPTSFDDTPEPMDRDAYTNEEWKQLKEEGMVPCKMDLDLSEDEKAMKVICRRYKTYTKHETENGKTARDVLRNPLKW